MLSAQHGFTLVEILVVIAVMAITGVFVVANYRSFGEDQNLKNAVLDIQSRLRAAQTNATSNVKCDSQYGATWQVELTNATTVNLKCSTSLNAQKPSLQLDAKNIAIQSVSGTGCPSGFPLTISFDPLTGKITLGGANCTSLTITLRNNKGTLRPLTIDQGGNIHE